MGNFTYLICHIEINSLPGPTLAASTSSTPLLERKKTEIMFGNNLKSTLAVFYLPWSGNRHTNATVKYNVFIISIPKITVFNRQAFNLL